MSRSSRGDANVVEIRLPVAGKARWIADHRWENAGTGKSATTEGCGAGEATRTRAISSGVQYPTSGYRVGAARRAGGASCGRPVVEVRKAPSVSCWGRGSNSICSIISASGTGTTQVSSWLAGSRGRDARRSAIRLPPAEISRGICLLGLDSAELEGLRKQDRIDPQRDPGDARNPRTQQSSSCSHRPTSFMKDPPG